MTKRLHSAVCGRLRHWRIARSKHLLFSILFIRWHVVRWPRAIMLIRNLFTRQYWRRTVDVQAVWHHATVHVH